MFAKSLKKPLFTLGVFVAFATNVMATELEPSSALTAKDKKIMAQLYSTVLKDNTAYEIVESLTTEVGHRMMGSEGDKKAIIWAVAKMKALGFDKVWTEKVTNTQWIRGKIDAKITAPYPQKVVAIALGGSIGTGEEGINAEVVQFSNFNALKAAPVGSLTGKIAFVSHRMSRHIDGHGYGKAVGTRVGGATVAAEKGAIALVIRSIGTDNNRIAHTGVMRYKDGVKKIPAVAISNPDADLLVNQLKRGKPVSFYLKSTASIKSDVIITSANVIGEITGSEKPNEKIVIGAHLDSWDVGTGALDDGVGVGMVLAAGHHIANLKYAPKRTVRVILFAAEEIGLLGAKQYMADRDNNVADHMIGVEWDFGHGKIYKMKVGVGSKALPIMAELGHYLAPLGVEFDATNDAVAQSDMSLFSKAGMPSVRFAPDGNTYFDYHHTENDTFDKVNAEDLKQTTTIYTLFTYFSAQANVDFSK